MRKRDLEALVRSRDRVIAEQNRTIEMLRAKLCHDGHDWVLADTVWEDGGACGALPSFVHVCARCGKRKVA